MIWQTLLFKQPTAENLPQRISNLLKATGHKAYDPFPGGLGSPIGNVTRQRLFLSPVVEGWQRLCVAPADVLSPELLQDVVTFEQPVIHVQMHDDEQFAVEVVGADSGLTALSSLLRDGLSIDELEAATRRAVLIDSQSIDNDLPPEIQQMARDQGVEVDQLNKLMGRMSKRVFRRAAKGDDDASMDDAKAAMNAQQARVNWNSVSGQRLQVVMDCLIVPSNFWRTPEWQLLTGAYQIARQQQRGKAMLLPGDQEKLQAVPNALDYHLLYFSKKV